MQKIYLSLLLSAIVVPAFAKGPATVVNGIRYEKIDSGRAGVAWVENHDDYKSSIIENDHTLIIPEHVVIDGKELTVTAFLDSDSTRQSLYSFGVNPNPHFKLTLPPSIETLGSRSMYGFTRVSRLTITSGIPPVALNSAWGWSSATDLFPMDWGGVSIDSIVVPPGVANIVRAAPGWRKTIDVCSTVIVEDSTLAAIENPLRFELNGWIAEITSCNRDGHEVELLFKVPAENESSRLEIPERLDHNGTSFTVISLADESFLQSEYITVMIPETVRHIGREALCSPYFKTIEGLKGVETLGHGALSSHNVRELTLPETMTEIASYTFIFGQSMGEYDLLKLPDALNMIQRQAFYRVNLNRVVCYVAEPPAADPEAFVDCIFGKLYVPDESVELYRNAPGWRQFEVVGINQAGIDNIGSADTETAPVEYYNLQGIRVNEPVKGVLYIERSASKSRKIIF